MYPSLNKSLNIICAWLEQTPLSQTIQVMSWVVPTVQTVHILAIAAVAGSALMIDLRLLGLVAVEQSLKDVSSRFLPFIWWPLLILLATGAIMIVGEPPRTLKNPVFLLKMTLLVLAIAVTGLFQYLVRRNPTFGASGSRQRVAAEAIAVVSLLLWTGIIFSGRWIAYYL
jgi:hypothetical protein